MVQPCRIQCSEVMALGNNNREFIEALKKSLEHQVNNALFEQKKISAEVCLYVNLEEEGKSHD